MVKILNVVRFLLVILYVNSENIAPLVQQYKIGATFCKYLAWKMQIHHRTDCGEPQCNWDSWHQGMMSKLPLNNSTNYKTRERVIVSYSHNGFGNQLWAHTAAFMAAESLNARLYISNLPENLRPDGQMPPNTWAGYDTMKKLLPSEFMYENLLDDSYEKQLCDKETFIIADRPRDWRNREYSSTFKTKLSNILSDPKPRCLKFLGYFQNLPLCYKDAKKLWTPPLFANFTNGPGSNDIAIYLRCVPRHYHFNTVEWYQTILDRLKFDKIWLFQAPECPNEIGNDPARDGPVSAVIRYLKEKHNAKKWPSAPDGSSAETYLLSDLAGLGRAKRLILPVSSWAYWGGVFSNATEIHVNAPPKHPLMEYNDNLYIYHDEKARLYYGKFNLTAYDLVYKVNLNEIPTALPTDAPSSGSRSRSDDKEKNDGSGNASSMMANVNITQELSNVQTEMVKYGDSYDLHAALKRLQQKLGL
jgi:hypothetical protein